MTDRYSLVIERLGPRVVSNKNGQASARCPAHDDRHASLSVKRGDDGRALVNCHANCPPESVANALGLTMRDLMPNENVGRSQPIVYDYTDENGEVLFEVLRFPPKDFRVRRFVNGTCVWNINGVRRVPYCLARLVAEKPKDVFIVEGEKDVDHLWRLGIPATTNVFGAGRFKAENARCLSAQGVQHVFVIPDNDAPGRAHAESVSRHCTAEGIEARIVRLEQDTNGADVSDWLKLGGTKEELLKLAEAAPSWKPVEERDVSECPKSGRDSSEGCDGEGVSADLQFVSADDLVERPVRKAVIENIAFEDSITTLIGESGSGKTFVALSMAAAVGAGVEWHGCNTERGSIAYVSFEGDALGARLRAIRDVQGIEISNVHVVKARDPISPARRGGIETPSSGEERLREAMGTLLARLLAQNAPPVRLLVIDTLRASLMGSEDDSDTVAAYLRMMRRLLATTPSAAALLVHHSGWQDGETRRRRERGSSALRGNVDYTLYLHEIRNRESSGQSTIVLEPLKMRDAAPFSPIRLLRRVVTIRPSEQDRDGSTSCVIETDTNPEPMQTEGDSVEVLARRALVVLAETPAEALTQDRIRGRLKVQKAKLTAAMRYLVAQDHARKLGSRGGYQITPSGLKLAA